MTKTNTDYLLQMTSAVDRTYGGAGASDDAGAFDDHLSQAASSSGDDSRNFTSGSRRTDTVRNDRDDPQWIKPNLKSSNLDGANTSTSQTSPSDHVQSTDKPIDSKAAIEDTGSDEHDSEKLDETTAAEVAGASQAAKDNSPKSNSKPEPNANANQPVGAKAAAISKKAATEAGSEKVPNKADAQATNIASSTDAVNQHAEEAAGLAAKSATDGLETDEDRSEANVTKSENQRSKVAKRDSSMAKLVKG